MADTLVRIALFRPGPGDEEIPANGYVECVPTRRRDIDDEVILPAKFTVRLGAELLDEDGVTVIGEATPGVAWAQLEPTDAGIYANQWAWRFNERTAGGSRRYCLVPTSVATVEYTDLVDVDIDTFDPVDTTPSAAWAVADEALRTDLEAQIAAVEAGDVDSVAGLTGTVTDVALKAGLNLPADTEAELAVVVSAINAEIIVREADDLALQADIDTKAAAVDLTTETTARTNADTALQADVNTRVKKPDADSWPIYLYGNSYATLSAAYFTAGNHYAEQVADTLDGGTVTSYGVSGKRILDVVSAVERQAAYPSLVTAPVAGAQWPGVSTRNGLVVLDSLMNDIGHYPSMAANPVIPAALPSANTKYLDSMTLAYRHVLAIMSSETRIEQTARTATSGTWTNDSPSTYGSGGSVSFTTAAGAYHEFSITPPQSGPLRGIVFVHGFTVEAAVLVMAQQTISVDGVVQLTRTPSAWERYTGPGGGNVDIGADCYPLTLPVDGNAHTVRLAHSGSAGQVMYSNFISIPSTDPNPIAVMGGDHAIAYTGWTAAQRSIFHANAKALIPVVKNVVAEFGNAFYVPSTITANGLYSADGLHPNDRGMAQRANDLQTAITTAIRARLESRRLANLDNSNFAIV